MHRRTKGTRLAFAVLAGALAALAIAACGSSSGDATKLLDQTFSGAHKVSSGNLNLSLAVTPSGSSSQSGPVSFSFGGPFQSLGPGKLPESDFTITVQALGKTGTLGIVSTGTNGYVTLQGSSYQLPAASFQKLESSFSQIASSGNANSGSGVLNKLGIQPLHWLVNPTIVGDETVGGTETTHIRADVNVQALLNDLNTFLAKASSLGVSGATNFPSGLPAATRQRIASAIQHPTFDVWTGTSDHTVRKLAINLTVAVSGEASTLLGGPRSADIGLNMQYASLNQPQTITAPTSVQPFNQFAAKIRAIFSNLQGVLGSGAASGSSGGTGTPGGTGAPGGTGTTGASGSGTPSSSALQRYSQCLQAAGKNIAKMQACAPLLNGSG